MKKMNRRQWIVTALSVVAISMVYKNVVQPIFGEPKQSLTESVSAPEDTLPQVSLFSNNSESRSEPALGAAMRGNTASLNTVFEQHRDPFSLPDQKVQLRSRYKNKSAKEIQKADRKARPKLTAVMLGPIQKYALVDGEIVSEGDSVNGVRILRIAEGTVLFGGSNGEFTLKLTSALIGNEYD